MIRSRLLDGLSVEPAPAVEAQIRSFDGATVFDEASRRAASLGRQAGDLVDRIGESADRRVAEMGWPGEVAERLGETASRGLARIGSTGGVVIESTAGLRARGKALGGRAGEIGRQAREMGRRAASRIDLPDWARRDRDDEDALADLDADGWRAAKLARILAHFDITFTRAPTDGQLLDACLKAEDDAVECLRRISTAGAGSDGSPPFEGASVLDLAQHVMRRLFDQLDAGFGDLTAEEQEQLAQQILSTLQDLPEDLRTRIRSEANLPELSTAALGQAGAIAAAGGAMIGTVGLAGFSAYAGISSAIASAASLFGVHLGFAFYVKAASMLAMASNPLVATSLTLVAGAALVRRANRQMRDGLVPIMVATAVVSGAAGEMKPIDAIGRRLREAHAAAAFGDRRMRRRICAAYPCLAI